MIHQIVKRLCEKHPMKQMYNRQYVSPLFFKQNFINLSSPFFVGIHFGNSEKRTAKSIQYLSVV